MIAGESLSARVAEEAVKMPAVSERVGTAPYALYNPALLKPELLLAEFTARRPLLGRLLDIIRANAPGEPPQHVLLVGPRGIGKTTLLWAIAHTIQLREPELRAAWQPVVFDEESRRVGDLADFWLECIRQWEFATKDNARRAEELLNRPGEDIEDRAREIFLKLVDDSGKRALLLIDNLNEIFANIHDLEPLRRLRAILMSDSRVMIIGGATRWFEEVTSIDKPFFEFFRSFELKPLSFEEMKECLLALAKAHEDEATHQLIEEREGSLRAMHLLTGGNPRLVKTFYRLLRDGLRTNIRTELEKLLDEFTPYFKAMVDALPAQQQRVLDAVALAWDPVEVAAIARATRLPSNQVSAQIRALTKIGYLTEAAGHPKKKTYLLADRFSNVHYLMRHGRAARTRLDWFVGLVRLVFPDHQSIDILARVAREAAQHGPEGRNDAESVIRSALRRAETLGYRDALLDRVTGSAKTDHEVDTELAEAACREALSQYPQDAMVHHKWGRFLAVHRRQFESAEVAYRKAIELDEKLAYPCNGLGNLLRNQNRFAEAEVAYRKAIELDEKFAYPWSGLGNVPRSQNRSAEAEAAYRKAIELDGKFAYPWNGLGNVLRNQNLFTEAEVAFRKAIELDEKFAYPWYGLGHVLADQQRFAEAEVAFRKAIELDEKFAPPWNGLGNVVWNQNRFAEAEAAYRKAIELDEEDAYPWNGMGNVLWNQNRPAEAEGAYRKAIELDEKFAAPWNGLGNVLANQLRFVEAEAAFRRATELDMNAAPWNGMGNVLRKQNRFAEAEVAYRKAIELDEKYATPWPGLADVLEKQGKQMTEARHYAATGLALKADYSFARHIFSNLCSDHLESWETALPALIRWCVAHPGDHEVFDFAHEGMLQVARLSSPAHALSLLEKQPDTAPFETLRDAFIAHADNLHLHRLAPERRALVLALLPKFAKEEKANGKSRKAQ